MSDPLTRLVELTVYAPIGAAAIVRERLPDLVADGRERVQQRFTVARFLGQMVVSQGRREVERRLGVHDEAPGSNAPTAPSSVPSPTSDAGIATTGPAERGPTADGLPIDDYESLAAGQVVARLRTLDPTELAAIESFERAHRNRRTVLNRIAQLRATP